MQSGSTTPLLLLLLSQASSTKPDCMITQLAVCCDFNYLVALALIPCRLDFWCRLVNHCNWHVHWDSCLKQKQVLDGALSSSHVCLCPCLDMIVHLTSDIVYLVALSFMYVFFSVMKCLAVRRLY